MMKTLLAKKMDMSPHSVRHSSPVCWVQFDWSGFQLSPGSLSVLWHLVSKCLSDFTQVYKWLPLNLIMWDNPVMD